MCNLSRDINTCWSNFCRQNMLSTVFVPVIYEDKIVRLVIDYNQLPEMNKLDPKDFPFEELTPGLQAKILRYGPSKRVTALSGAP